MPASRSRACAQDRRTTSFVRNSSLHRAARPRCPVSVRVRSPALHSLASCAYARSPSARQAARPPGRIRGRRRKPRRRILVGQLATVPIAAPRRSRSPSLDPLFRLLAADLARVNQLIVVAHAQPGGADPAAGRPYRRGRRQAAAADADPRLRRGCAAIAASGTSRSPPRRVHPHRDAAARRCRRRERSAARPRHRERRLGQQAGRAGRRFPVRPRVRADGRGRLAARAGNPVARRRGDRRGRGRRSWSPPTTRRPPRPPISRSSRPRRRRCSPRRAASARSSPSARRRRRKRSNASAAISASPSS